MPWTYTARVAPASWTADRRTNVLPSNFPGKGATTGSPGPGKLRRVGTRPGNWGAVVTGALRDSGVTVALGAEWVVAGSAAVVVTTAVLPATSPNHLSVHSRGCAGTGSLTKKSEVRARRLGSGSGL